MWGPDLSGSQRKISGSLCLRGYVVFSLVGFKGNLSPVVVSLFGFKGNPSPLDCFVFFSGGEKANGSIEERLLGQ